MHHWQQHLRSAHHHCQLKHCTDDRLKKDLTSMVKAGLNTSVHYWTEAATVAWRRATCRRNFCCRRRAATAPCDWPRHHRRKQQRLLLPYVI